MTNVTIANASVVLPDRVLERGTVRVDDGRISLIEPGPVNPVTTQEHIVDADGAYLIPGVVDLHNDNLELEVHPRASANLPLPFALSVMERRLAASGVTTEFHAVAFQERKDKNRHLTDAEVRAAFLSPFDDDPRRGVRHHILHRLDMRTPGSLEAALPTLRRASVPYISLNDHTPGQGQYRDVERFIALAQQEHATRGREQTSAAWYHEQMRAKLADTETVPAFYRQVAAAMSDLPMTLATHDDDTIAKVDAQLMLGARIAEFPITLEAAHHAREHGMAVVVGAPNILRGGSQSGNLNATDLVAAGLADIICADYHAPCLIPAAFRLVQDGLLDLPAAIAMITRTPARAVGFTDRGEITSGQLADLALVRVDASGLPQVEATFCGGIPAFTFARYPEKPGRSVSGAES